MYIKALIISFLLLILNIGCSTFNPRYKQPTLKTPENWNNNIHNNITIVDKDIPKLEWWKEFNDSTLNSLITIALKNNNNIQISIGKVLEANAIKQRANYSWIPTIDLELSTGITQLLNDNMTLSSTIPQSLSSLPSPKDITTRTIGLLPKYNLNILRQLKSQDIANLNLHLQKYAMNAIRLAIIDQVSSNYFTLLGLKKQLLLQRSMLVDARNIKKHLLIQYELGNISMQKVIATQQLISTIRQNIPTIENNLTKTQNALKLLINKNPGKIITSSSFDNININNIIPINLPSQLLKSRPDIAIAEYQLRISNAEIALAASQLFPSINLTGIIGNIGYYLKDFASFTTNLIGGSIAAGTPVFDMGIFANINKNKANYYSAYFNYIETVRRSFVEVENQLSEYNTTKEKVKYQSYTLINSYKQYQLTQSMYELGATSYLDTLITKLNVDYSLIELNKYKIKQINNIVKLYSTIGAGYYASGDVQPKKFNDEHDI